MVTVRLGSRAPHVNAGAALLGVATVGEGQVLRAHGIDAPIVLLGSIDASEAPAACEAGLEITVAGEWLLESVQRAARAVFASSPVSVHLKVDTGLRRYGATPSEAVALGNSDSRRPVSSPCQYLHAFRLSGRTRRAVHGRISCGNSTTWLRTCANAGVRLPPLHAANSAGILTGRGTDYAFARAGIALYGVPPSSAVPLLPGMRAEPEH